MSEENREWQSPPPPSEPIIEVEKPKMSLLQTFTDIFFEPANVFEDLRKKPFPRFLIALLICGVLVSGYNFALVQRLGNERIVQEQLRMPIMENMPEDAKKKMVEDAKNQTTVKTILQPVGSFVGFLFVFLIIGLVYWGGGLAFGGSGNFWHALSVVTYSSFPPIIVSMLASFIILYLKSPDDISFMDSQSGLLKINPNMLLDVKGALKALFTRIDLMAIWGVFLSAVGLQYGMRVSSVGSWIFSIIIWLIGTTIVVVLGSLFGV